MYLIDKNSHYSYLNCLESKVNSVRKEFFKRFEEQKESYWVNQESDKIGVREYSFDTLPQLETMLNNRLEDWKEVLHSIVIDAFRKRRDYEEVKDVQDSDMSIPDYVYTF